jgi:4'-phosphopantetheinyl transferase
MTRGTLDVGEFPWLSITCASPAELSDSGRRGELMAMLSADEIVRHDRMCVQANRDLFLSSHGLLRESLSTRAGVPPAEWQFTAGPYGRPEIAAPAAALRFSLSHTNGLAVCAITTRGDVGIDVEDRSRPWSAGLADRLFSARERRDLMGASSADRQARFFEYWTLKEAYLKARGVGLLASLQDFSFYRAEECWQVEFAPGVDDDPRRWKFKSWLVDGAYQAALAVTLDKLPAGPDQNDQHDRTKPIARLEVARGLRA